MSDDYTKSLQAIERALSDIKGSLTGCWDAVNDLSRRIQPQPRIAGAIKPVSFFDHNGSACMVLKTEDCVMLVTPFGAEDVTGILQDRARELERADMQRWRGEG